MLQHRDQSMEYGTVSMARVERTEAEAAPQGRSTATKVVVAFMALALVTMAASGVSSSRVRSVVDSNRDRANLAKISPEVKEMGSDVLNMTVSGYRWAIFGFNRDKDLILPLSVGPATADWEKDFKQFVNSLPELDAAVGVYNFEYWVDDETTGVEPVMITWAPSGIDPREEARAGFYLPGIILALNSDSGRLNTAGLMSTGDTIGKAKAGYASYDHTGFSGPYRLDSISDSYGSFCENEMGLPEKECNLEKGFHNCPFESEDEAEWTDANPCKQAICDGDSFQKPTGAQPGTISQGCCDYIQKDFCAAPENAMGMGCHMVTLTAIDKLCEVPQPADPVISDFSWSGSPECAPECADSCKIFDDPNDTWRKCEGCRIDMMPDPDADNAGQISQCFPGALGFEMNTCCGNELNADGGFLCEEDDNLSYEACNMLEYYDCKWIPQKDCPEEKRAQDIADAPTGCCYMAGTGADLFGTDSLFHFDEGSETWDASALDEQIPSVLCGGGKYADEADTSTFAEGEDCATVKAGFDAALQAHLDMLAAEEAAAAEAGE